MTTAVRLIEGAAPRKVTIKIEVDSDAPEMGAWAILEKFCVVRPVPASEIARAMSTFMKRHVSRQMVERWFRTDEPMTPRTDYFLALLAVLQSRFKLVEEPGEALPPEPKRPPGRPKKDA